MSGSFSKQSSNEQSTSSNLGLSENAASSFGNQGSQSSSLSQGSSVGGSSQTVAFEDLFKKLYGGASGAADAVNTGAISTAAKSLFTSGTGFLDTLSGVGSDATTDAQVGALKTTLGDFFNEQLLPGITREGVSTGTLGGSRDAVATGQAAKGVASQLSAGVASILGNRDAAKTGAAGTGLSALQSLLGIDTQGELAGLSPYQALAQIVGGPTVLGSSFSQSQDIASALSDSFGVSGSQSYGFDYSSGKSQSTGNQKGFGISGGIGYSNASPKG